MVFTHCACQGSKLSMPVNKYDAQGVTPNKIEKLKRKKFPNV